MSRALFAFVTLVMVGCGSDDGSPLGTQPAGAVSTTEPQAAEHQVTGRGFSPPVYRLVGDFDGDGRDDVAVGEACGVHGACAFEVSLSAPNGAFGAAGSVFATYDEVGLCPGDPPRLVTTVRQGTEYARLEYLVTSDSVWVVASDTSSLAGGGPPDSWWARECAEGLDFYEATEADVDARGDSAWQPLVFQF